ncbi:class II aldolase/adducin family protein [Aquimarina gracilis]|uniref:Class II aldolase/adducin family protein n=1 Tax=Aquimarina gracilis TaxID=874422 RepID=A0ABU6A0E0_9FLAO|nr:class II aldolase/adducin family protein [Aquimarina gracilis]MEB3347525.1 class II aldolase/adducin family protein [Aquimarina gracilis]
MAVQNPPLEMLPANIPLPPKFDDVVEERAYLKKKLTGAFRIFGKFGFSEGVAGHITVRDPEHHDHFWVNPFGLSFNQIKPSDLLLVNHKGTVVEGKLPVNRAAFAIHSQIHAARPDVVAAAHAHSVYGKSFSALGKELAPITQDACAFYKDHALFDDYSGIVNELEEGKRIAKALADNKAAILQNHGLITVGHSIDEAAWWFITMERSCQAQLLAMQTGEELIEIDHQTAMKTRTELGFPLAGYFQFQPMWQDISVTLDF